MRASLDRNRKEARAHFALFTPADAGGDGRLTSREMKLRKPQKGSSGLRLPNIEAHVGLMLPLKGTVAGDIFLRSPRNRNARLIMSLGIRASHI